MTANPEPLRSETREELTEALRSVDADIVRLTTVRIALTDALFPPSSVDSGGASERLSDNFLELLGRRLRRMDKTAWIVLGASCWSPSDLYSIVEEVMRSRAAPDRAEAMRAQVLALLDGYAADFAHGMTKDYGTEIKKDISSKAAVIAEARGQIAEMEVQ